MNEFQEQLTPEEARAREEVRRLSKPQANAAFRERLKQEFVSGAIAERPGLFDDAAHDVPATDDAEAAAISGGGNVVAVPWFRRPALAWLPAAAAAAVLIVAALMLNRGPAWDVVAASGDGVAVVDGRPVPMNHVDELGRAIRAGSRVVLPAGAEVQLMSEGNMAIVFTAGAEFTMPDAPGRWWGREIGARLDKGTVRVVASESFAGGLLTVTTPDMVVQLADATLAVECVDVGTCVCVLTGEAMVSGEGIDAVAVSSGRRRVLFSDGSDPMDDAMLETERAALVQLTEKFGAI